MLSLSGTALAQPDEAAEARAKDLNQQGETAYAAGRYTDAVSLFRQAHELSERPLLLFNIANAHERLGDYEAAAHALREYSKHATADETGTLDERVRRLEGRATEKRDAEAKAKADAAAAASKPAPPPTTLPTEPREQIERRSATPGIALVAVGGALIVAEPSPEFSQVGEERRRGSVQRQWVLSTGGEERHRSGEDAAMVRGRF